MISVLQSALEYRRGIVDPSDDQGVARLFAGTPDGLPGLIIDKMGPVIWARSMDSRLALDAQDMFHHMTACLPEHRICFAFRKMSADHDREVFEWMTAGSIDDVQASEDGLRYLISSRPATHLAGDFGLYVDAHVGRRWIKDHAQGRRVLNLYSYTCGFGVCAAKGGAATVTNVDVSREVLTWGKNNAGLNGVDFAVVPEDAMRYVERLRTRVTRGAALCPDLVVIDAPAFLFGRGSDRLLRHVLPRLLNLLFCFLPDNAKILLSCNDRHLAFGGGQRVTEMLRHVSQESGRHIHVKALKQTPDVLGQEPDQADPFYTPPLFWTVTFTGDQRSVQRR
jgi:23S rRNA G2069 N7-methylase RlmK/C1962 C5-methylase RlmI